MSNVNPDVKSLFFDAIDQKSPEELRGFLDRACTNDANLRAQLEQLLHAHRDAGKFLGGATPVTIDHPHLELPGTQIGPYKLLEQIGEGGMGIVYVASQKEPLRRQVALKIIKPGMDTREVVARFEAERQGPGDDGSSEHRQGVRCRCDRYGSTVLCDGVGQRIADYGVL